MRWSSLGPALQLLGIGWFFAASIVGGAGLGLLIDGWLGATPVFTLLGLGLGLAVAFYGGYRLLMEFVGKKAGGKDGDV